MNTLISVVIPVYQVEQYLKECIESVISQTINNWEIILVNDGSTDKSGEICEQYASKDSRIRIIHKNNGGLSDARNSGLNITKGDFIIFLDSDDYWSDSNFLQKVKECISNNNDIEMILFEGKKYIENKNTYVSDNKLNVNFINNNNVDEIIKHLIINKTYSMSACTKILKKDFLIDNKIKFERGLLGEDLDWFLNILVNIKKIKAIESVNYIYRFREGSITKTISLKNLEDQFWILDKWIPIIKDRKGNSKYIRYYFGVLAYSYVIDIILYSQLKYKDKKKVRYKMKQYSYLLSYNVNKIIKITDKVYKALGLDVTSYLLKIYYFIK